MVPSNFKYLKKSKPMLKEKNRYTLGLLNIIPIIILMLIFVDNNMHIMHIYLLTYINIFFVSQHQFLFGGSRAFLRVTRVRVKTYRSHTHAHNNIIYKLRCRRYKPEFPDTDTRSLRADTYIYIICMYNAHTYARTHATWMGIYII